MKIKNKIINDFKEVKIDELPDVPVYALKGISDRNALTLYKTLHIETIRDLAHLNYAQWAKELCDIAENDKKYSKNTFKDRLIKDYQDASPEELINTSPIAFYGISKKSIKLLKKDFSIHTIKDFAEFKFVQWAQNIDYKDKLIKKYENSPLGQLPSAPVFALQGVSKKDGELLSKAFGITTIQDLAELHFILWAKEIFNLAQSEVKDIIQPELIEKLTKRYEKKTPNQLTSSPVQALQGLSKKDGDLLKKAFNVKTIEDLAHLKYAQWAKDIMDLNEHANNIRIPNKEKKSFSWWIPITAALLIGLIYLIIIKFDVIQKTIKDTFPAAKKSSSKKTVTQKENKKDIVKRKIITKTIVKTEKKIIKKKPLKIDTSNTYVVKSGDTLVKISEKLYGTYKKWPQIYRMNKGKLTHPTKIFIGQQLKIPKKKK